MAPYSVNTRVFHPPSACWNEWCIGRCTFSVIARWMISGKNWQGAIPWVKYSGGRNRVGKFFLSPFDYSSPSLSCQHSNCTNLSSQSELAAGPTLYEGVKACHERGNEWAENGPRKLIARMEGREEYVHPLINLIVFMGQRVHISAACIMRAWNKVIHCILFQVMGVWAKDQEERPDAKLWEHKGFPVHRPLGHSMFIKYFSC